LRKILDDDKRSQISAAKPPTLPVADLAFGYFYIVTLELLRTSPSIDAHSCLIHVTAYRLLRLSAQDEAGLISAEENRRSEKLHSTLNVLRKEERPSLP
jgi:hypothetical protein